MDMLLFKDKKDCCGCGACFNICPKNAITMQEDMYGYIYPAINSSVCVDCGRCQKV
ncbi:MAG: 4Fe-4S binding protein, partial [Oscillospiraceae bacterium]|nr:4Fe-4S binding protein [Oscillospiraceae bacterium]